MTFIKQTKPQLYANQCDNLISVQYMQLFLLKSGKDICTFLNLEAAGLCCFPFSVTFVYPTAGVSACQNTFSRVQLSLGE